MAKPVLLIIDGSALIQTQYYGSLPDCAKRAKTEMEQIASYPMIRHTRDGKFTNGVMGALNMIFRVLRDQCPDYLVVVMDKNSQTTFRKKKYPRYKGARKEKPAPLAEQIQTFKEILGEIGVPVLEDDLYEADDFTGSVVEKFKKVASVGFVTKDHDYLQLIEPGVTGYMLQNTVESVSALSEKYKVELGADVPYKTFPFDLNVVWKEEVVFPYQIVDLKALKGDTADSIPGVPGIGSVAVPLLAEYRTIHGLYAAIDACVNERAERILENDWWVRLGIRRGTLEKLKKGRESAYLSRELATIVRDVCVPEDIEWYKVDLKPEHVYRALKRYELQELYEKYKEVIGEVIVEAEADPVASCSVWDRWI